MKLKGIPVLFIPGNAGSYKQGKDQHRIQQPWQHFVIQISLSNHLLNFFYIANDC